MNKELREDLEHLIICNDKTITQDLRDDVKMTLDYIDELENKIDKAIEYITSYESIEEIQHCERIEDNKELDYNTMVEMNRRYLIVHDKLLDILRGTNEETK